MNNCGKGSNREGDRPSFVRTSDPKAALAPETFNPTCKSSNVSAGPMECAKIFSVSAPRSKVYPNVDISNWPKVDIEITHDYDTTTRQSRHTTSIDYDAIVTDPEDTNIGMVKTLSGIVDSFNDFDDTHFGANMIDVVPNCDDTYFGAGTHSEITNLGATDVTNFDVANVVNHSEHNFDIGVSFTDSYGTAAAKKTQIRRTFGRACLDTCSGGVLAHSHRGDPGDLQPEGLDQESKLASSDKRCR